MAEAVARLVHYLGRVQGVGFRATTVHLAQRYPVSGWVRNLPDGGVQLLVEGESSAVEAFLQAVRSSWGNDIEEERCEEQAVSGRHTSFRIVR